MSAFRASDQTQCNHCGNKIRPLLKHVCPANPIKGGGSAQESSTNCKICGKAIHPTLKHKCSGGGAPSPQSVVERGNSRSSCKTCGRTIHANIAHKCLSAPVQTQETCIHCKRNVRKGVHHDCTGTGDVGTTCNTCGKKIHRNLPHNCVPLPKKEANPCRKCGQEVGNSLNHDCVAVAGAQTLTHCQQCKNSTALIKFRYCTHDARMCKECLYVIYRTALEKGECHFTCIICGENLKEPDVIAICPIDPVLAAFRGTEERVSPPLSDVSPVEPVPQTVKQPVVVGKTVVVRKTPKTTEMCVNCGQKKSESHECKYDPPKEDRPEGKYEKCEICEDDQPLYKFKKCTHDATACKNCLYQTYKGKVEESVFKFNCYTCNTVLTYADVKAICSKKNDPILEAFNNHPPVPSDAYFGTGVSCCECSGETRDLGTRYVQCRNKTCDTVTCKEHRMKASPYDPSIRGRRFCCSVGDILSAFEKGAPIDPQQLHSLSKEDRDKLLGFIRTEHFIMVNYLCCPYCHLPFENIGGCHQRECGRDTHSTGPVVGGGCGREFLYEQALHYKPKVPNVAEIIQVWGA